MNEPVLCLLPGISKEKGWEYYRIYPKSVNTERFLDYLKGLREANGDDKICIFMDNLSVHTSEKTKKYMRELDFKFIYNLKYSPETNPIEFVFSKVKHNFKNLFNGVHWNPNTGHSQLSHDEVEE